jgi:hypothetical protein
MALQSVSNRAELGERIVAIFEERNEATDGSLRLPQGYLLSVIRL